MEKRKQLRELVYKKFDGLCAYTGKPLDDKWQVDHAEPLIRKKKKIGGEYVRIDTGEVVKGDEFLKHWRAGNITKTPEKIVNDGYCNPENDCIENMLPAIYIINHYKSSCGVESFRRYISTLHLRVKKLPKKTSLLKTKKRIEYVLNVASLFEITADKPFSGKFYFETINQP